MHRGTTLKRFITTAEGQWLHVFYSGRKTRYRTAEGTPLELLPTRFNSREKIYRFFRLFWGKRLAEQMIGNLPLSRRCGCLYVIAYDAGPMSVVVRVVRVMCRSKQALAVLTKLSGGPEGRVGVIHVLARRKPGGYTIVKRHGPSYDFRYYKPEEHIRKWN